MPISNLVISQDNKVGDSNLMPIHSPLIFLIDAEYTGAPPSSLYVDIIKEGTILETYSCIPYKDPLGNTRTFAFIASEVLKSYLGSFDDFAQLDESFVYVDGITQELTLNFYSKDDQGVSVGLVVDLCHASNQFGDYPNMVDTFLNSPQVYYAPCGEDVYIYFYNDNPDNVLTIDTPVAIEVIARNYDGTEFVNYDDTEFTIDIAL